MACRPEALPTHPEPQHTHPEPQHTLDFPDWSSGMYVGPEPYPSTHLGPKHLHRTPSCAQISKTSPPAHHTSLLAWDPTPPHPRPCTCPGSEADAQVPRPRVRLALEFHGPQEASLPGGARSHPVWAAERISLCLCFIQVFYISSQPWPVCAPVC